MIPARCVCARVAALVLVGSTGVRVRLLLDDANTQGST
jgi:hypothetical protein